MLKEFDMSIHDATEYFQELIAKTDNESNLKLYRKFHGILAELKEKDLTEEQLKSIEEELTGLDLKSISLVRKKQMKQKLAQLLIILRDEYSLVTEDHYTRSGIVLGIGFGTAIGLILGIPVSMPLGLIYGGSYGLVLGLIVGLFIGRTEDAEAKKQNRVIHLNGK